MANPPDHVPSVSPARVEQAREQLTVDDINEINALLEKVAPLSWPERKRVADLMWKLAFLGQQIEHQTHAAVRAEPAKGWQPIAHEHKDGTLWIVAMITGGRVWRVSDAAHNGLGWYTKSGEACHWATHCVPLPAAPPVEAEETTHE